MEAINERFIELRKACNKNQSDFAKVLGLSRSGVTAIETGQRKVTEKHLIMLANWSEYNVNIEWLRTGEGEMFKKLDRESEIAAMTAMLFKEEESSFKYRLIAALSRMDDDGWRTLEQLAKEITGQKD